MEEQDITMISGQKDFYWKHTERDDIYPKYLV